MPNALDLPWPTNLGDIDEKGNTGSALSRLPPSGSRCLVATRGRACVGPPATACRRHFPRTRAAPARVCRGMAACFSRRMRLERRAAIDAFQEAWAGILAVDLPTPVFQTGPSRRTYRSQSSGNPDNGLAVRNLCPRVRSPVYPARGSPARLLEPHVESVWQVCQFV